jgi:hypothetical protein
MNRI